MNLKSIMLNEKKSPLQNTILEKAETIDQDSGVVAEAVAVEGRVCRRGLTPKMHKSAF